MEHLQHHQIHTVQYIVLHKTNHFFLLPQRQECFTKKNNNCTTRKLILLLRQTNKDRKKNTTKSNRVRRRHSPSAPANGCANSTANSVPRHFLNGFVSPAVTILIVNDCFGIDCVISMHCGNVIDDHVNDCDCDFSICEQRNRSEKCELKKKRG